MAPQWKLTHMKANKRIKLINPNNCRTFMIDCTHLTFAQADFFFNVVEEALYQASADFMYELKKDPPTFLVLPFDLFSRRNPN